jgi:hypothetical protein
MRRKRKWPSVNLHWKGGSGAIKTVSASQLEHLMDKAKANSWSAYGRPAWFADHRGEFAEALVVIFGPEGRDTVYRCVTTVVLRDDTGGFFSLDMSSKDFNALDDLDYRGTVLMAHRYLLTFPHVPVPDMT